VRKPEHGGAVVGFLSKPFDGAELTRVVTEALAVQA
jgi:FixJ family two-component response regulator